MISEIADWARLVNLVLCAAVIAGMAVNWQVFARATRGWQMLSLAMGALVGSALIGTVETLIYDRPAPGIRTYLITLALGWALVAMILIRRDRRR